MKNATLLVTGMALLLAISVGCRSTQPKVSPLPGSAALGDGAGDTRGARSAPDLNTNPTTPSGNVSGAGVSSTAVPTDLPDPDKLDGRDQDRSTFSAETILFDFDRSNVRASEAGKIATVAGRFKSLPAGHDLLIEGHCDERGTEGYNQALGERRALSIRELLVQSGIDGQHVFTKSLGKDQPADPGHNETAWGKNRRGEFILVLPKKITTTQKP